MNYALQIKIIRSLGYAVGVVQAATFWDIPNELMAKLKHAHHYLSKSLDEIMKELEENSK